MSEDILIFERDGVFAAFNRLSLEVAFGSVKSEVEKAVLNDAVSLAAYKTLASEQKADFRVLNLILTNACDFDCTYCYEKKLQLRPGNMSLETATKSIRALLYHLPSKTEKPYYLYFYGGEPLLNFEVLKKSAAYFQEESSRLGREFYIGLVTNGSRLSRDVADYFKTNEFDVTISIDGEKAVNDEGRKAKNGRSAYDVAEAAISNARDVGLSFDISLTIGKHNITKIREQVNFLVRTFEPRRVILNIPVILGKDDLAIAQSAFSQAIGLREYLWGKNSTDKTLPKFAKRFVERDIGWRHCECQRHQLVVRPDGVVGPCLLLQDNSAYFDRTIGQVLEAPVADGPFPEFMDRASVSIEECEGCPAIMVCRGGCAANSISCNGRLFGPDPLICPFPRRILEDFIWSTYGLYALPKYRY